MSGHKHPTTPNVRLPVGYASRLETALNGLNVLVRIQEEMLGDPDEIPEWWSEFYQGGVVAALKTCAGVLEDVAQPMIDEAREKDRGDI